MENKVKKIIISGGGTGGHIFPAIAIANALKKADKDVDILFVGANGRMEMEKVPAAGYKIIGLPVAGFQRRLSIKNLSFIFKLIASLRKAKKIITDFKPDVVVGVGGYASGPVLKAAQNRGIPTLIQEQNSYAGVTNKLLAKKASKICVAYDNMEKYFPANKIIKTGNPVRADILNPNISRDEAFRFFELDPDMKTLLVIGGSLGARSINNCICQNLDVLLRNKIQVIWQTGKTYFETAKLEITKYNSRHLRMFEFIQRMDLAYKAADLVVSRAGACTISEVCLVKKPVILVPSPNVAEDHQTKNAMALSSREAAIMVADKNAALELINQVIQLAAHSNTMEKLSHNAGIMAMQNSDTRIADEIFKLIR